MHAPNIAGRRSRQQPDAVATFEEWCRLRAELYAAGSASLLDCVDALWDGAERMGLVASIGQDAVQAIMAAAFEPVRDDLVPVGDKVADEDPPAARFTRDRYGLTRVMRETADHLLRTQNMKEIRAWLAFLNARDVQAVRQYMQQQQKGAA